jgi:glutathione peroxidase
MNVPSIIFSLFCLLQIMGCNAKKTIALTRPMSVSKGGSSIYDIEVTTIDGKTQKLDAYRGKKIIVLNVASKCGYTDQYKDWQDFYESKGEKVVILGFPCNQFLWQENGSNGEIAQFCKLKYDVSFPMFEKINVKGSEQSNLYNWLSNPEKNGWNKQTPVWNFCKYIIDEEGKLLAFYSSKALPQEIKELN